MSRSQEPYHTTKNYIRNKLREKGFFNNQVIVTTTPISDTTGQSMSQNMRIIVDKGPARQGQGYRVYRNTEFSDSKLKGSMKNVKQRNFFRFWKRSKYTEDLLEEDKVKIIDKYKASGFRDARIVTDTLINNSDKAISLEMGLRKVSAIISVTFALW